MLARSARWALGVDKRSCRCLRSWKSCAVKRWATLFGTVVYCQTVSESLDQRGNNSEGLT